MLNFLRNAARTWVFKALFALLVVSFAIWGIGDVTLNTAGSRVAKVGDRVIETDDFALALQREIQSLSRQMGRRITVEEAEAAGVHRALLARLARDAALDEEARRLGVSAPDEAVRDAIVESPSFKGLDGRFDKQQYEFILSQLGFKPARFEEDMRRSLARDVLLGAASAGARAPAGYAELQLAPRLEKRELALVILDPAALPAPAAPDEAALRAWFDARKDAYVAPRARDLTYALIDPAKLAAQVEIPEDELRADYEADAERFNIPERRVIDRLPFPDENAARAALARIEAGEATFEDLARERGLTLEDVTLGALSREAAPPELADLAFSDGTGVKGPASTPLGPALINVRAILPASVTPFEEARETLRAERAGARAQALASDMAEQLADLIAAGARLEDAAAELGLELRTAKGVTLSGEGVEGPAASSEFLAAAFAAEEGLESDPFSLPGGAWAALRVDGERPERPLSFEEARERVLRDWTAEARRKALADKAAAIADALAAGADADELARIYAAKAVRTGPVTRDAAVEGAPDGLIAALFRAAKGQARSTVAEDGSAAAAGVVLNVIPADLADPTYAQILARWREALDRSTGRDLQALYAQALFSRAEVTVNEAALRRVLNGLR